MEEERILSLESYAMDLDYDCVRFDENDWEDETAIPNKQVFDDKYRINLFLRRRGKPITLEDSLTINR